MRTKHTVGLTSLCLGLFLATAPAQANPSPERAVVVRDDATKTVLQVQIGAHHLKPVRAMGRTFVQPTLDGESPLKNPGEPELPVVSRSIVIPDDGTMSVRILSADYTEHEAVDVLPSKGILSRSVDPAQVPYSLGAVYQQDQFYPGDLASLGQPYILRDHRGLVVKVFPFQYNPVTRTLRVYHNIVLEVTKAGPGGANVLTYRPPARTESFDKIARHHFLNARTADRYVALNELGDMLIIAHDAWLPNVQPLVAHKNSIGIPATAVGISTVGDNPNDIKAYIQNAYDTGNLAYVLLVGDIAHIPSPGSWGVSDPSYSKLAGSDDYPDILIGRFSAESAEDVDTQVQRTIEYELMPATEQDWFRTAVGIGSDEGPGDDGEMDNEHIAVIREDLLAYGYTQVDELYDPGATSTSVTTALNEGRGLINYCGHGSIDSWVTTGFTNNDVAALNNNGKLPFIWSVACNNGEFDTGTCFGEAWLRARNASGPVGAIGIYASSISQSWDPPMAAQDEAVDLLTTDQYISFGGLCFAGSAKMMDEYGDGGVEMFDTWHVFGDPSVRIFGTAVPPTGLRVLPYAGLSAQGDPGGPFVPSEMVYTLENHHTAPIEFSVTHTANWLTVAPASGSIAPAGSVAVTVSLSDDANLLYNGVFEDELQFVNTTNHDGDSARSARLKIGIPHPQYEWNLDTDPGWTVDGGWAFGAPQGQGGDDFGEPDPSSAATGDNVYGYNLAGDYPNSMSQEYLTTGAIDCTLLTEVSLRFSRWLNVEDSMWDKAAIEASTDGTTWTPVWNNSGEIVDSSWVTHTVDLSQVADNAPELYLRWSMGPTDDYWGASGWNIDDIEIWGVKTCLDGDGDGFVSTDCGGQDCDDEAEDVHPDMDEACDDTIDNDCDSLIDDSDPECQGTAGTAGAAGQAGAAGTAGSSGSAGTGGNTGGTAGNGGSGGSSAGSGGQSSDAGSDPSPDDSEDSDSGCGCRTAPQSTPPALGLVGLLATALLLRRRK